MDVFDARSQTGHDLPAFRTRDGRIRLLAALPNPGLLKLARFGDANPVIPRSEWKPFARVRSDVPILDQGQVGSCNAHGFTSAVMRARSAAGQAFQLLSASMLYALINGGSDSGSAPEDAAREIVQTGICLDSEVPEGFYTIRDIPSAAMKTAARFKVDAGSLYEIQSFDELVSAVILGFKVPMTVKVAGNWNDFDKDGCPPFRRGQANHVTSDDDSLVQFASGEWAVPSRNSWSTKWGNNGRYNFSETAWDTQSGPIAYALKFAGEDPEDANAVPAAS